MINGIVNERIHDTDTHRTETPGTSSSDIHRQTGGHAEKRLVEKSEY